MGKPTFDTGPASGSGAFELSSTGDLDLKHLAEQLTAIANRLRSESPVKTDRGVQPGHPVLVRSEPAQDTEGPGQNRGPFVALARNLYITRRKRESIFGNSELFGEPAWDILLDLYIAHAEAKKVSVSSACIGSAAPSTTGLRWLGILAEHELVVREQDHDDQRRVLVRLSEAGLEAMDSYFSSLDASAYKAPKQPRPA
ncbi:MarR family transcriptional regulator [Erythrobacter crassostreae]|uniref:MarR family transcriptional regulator n=1 Tax=Erythrobacter crassostreae TaxID=2828328 RepID=A0A9X1F4Q2_9SPHN|nr:MarR family transcriptional regulator [Erythrobacter crassostrea]MBV7259926.1 MarR family transcriptional regulator [Erythrobacter crassostrea]